MPSVANRLGVQDLVRSVPSLHASPVPLSALPKPLRMRQTVHGPCLDARQGLGNIACTLTDLDIDLESAIARIEACTTADEVFDVVNALIAELRARSISVRALLVPSAHRHSPSDIRACLVN